MIKMGHDHNNSCVSQPRDERSTRPLQMLDTCPSLRSIPAIVSLVLAVHFSTLGREYRSCMSTHQGLHEYYHV